MEQREKAGMDGLCRGLRIIKRIEGGMDTVMGLPLELLRRLINEILQK